jgi:hypothetical protein
MRASVAYNSRASLRDAGEEALGQEIATAAAEAQSINRSRKYVVKADASSGIILWGSANHVGPSIVGWENRRIALMLNGIFSRPLEKKQHDINVP